MTIEASTLSYRLRSSRIALERARAQNLSVVIARHRCGVDDIARAFSGATVHVCTPLLAPWTLTL